MIRRVRVGGRRGGRGRGGRLAVVVWQLPLDLLMRTLRGLWPAWARPDDALARVHLTDRDYALYASLDRRDRDHATRVVRRLLVQWPQAHATLVRAAWLHDVGKAGRPYRLLERVVVHLWCPDERTARRFPAPWRAAWRVHRHHAALGAARLRAIGSDPQVVRLVAAHHDASADAAVRQLQWADRHGGLSGRGSVGARVAARRGARGG
jgi:putative nucleotidyltransferase with HDIG domain